MEPAAIEKLTQLLQQSLPTLYRLAEKAVGTDLVLMALLDAHPQRDVVIKQINEMAEGLAELRGNSKDDHLLAQVRLLTQQPEQDDVNDHT